MFFPARVTLGAAVVVGAGAWSAGHSALAVIAAEKAPQPQPSAAAPVFDAEYVSMDVPKQLITDQVFQVKIVMKNTGSQDWGPASATHAFLRSQDPPDNTTWGTNFIIQGQGRTVKSSQEFAFVSYLKAPGTPGEYAFQWRLAKKEQDRAFFGQPTAREMIRVQQRPAEPPSLPPPPADPSAKRVLAFEDFEYVGSFKVPDRVAGGGAGYSESGLALRRMKDGARRLFVNFTHPAQALFEVDIPPLVKLEGGNHAALKVAPVKKVWGAIEVKVPENISASVKTIRPAGGIWWDDGQGLLYWTWSHSYWTGHVASTPVLGVSKLDDDGTMTHSGPWLLPEMTPDHHKAYWGGVTKLPQEFADKYTGGRTLALGFGGAYSICATCSRGPALAAISEPKAGQGTLKIIELLAYPQGAIAPRDGDYFAGQLGYWNEQPQGPARGYWTPVDFVHSAVFIDSPRGHAYLAFPRLATGRLGYDYGTVSSGGMAFWWYFYDPGDLAAAAQRIKKPWEIVPRSRTKVRLPGQNAGEVTGSCFDGQQRLLYLYHSMAFRTDVEPRPCVHVYRLTER